MVIEIEQPSAGRTGSGRMGLGLAGSVLLHGLAALLILLNLPGPTPPPPPDAPQAIPIDLVRLGAKSAGPMSPQMAALPQQQAPETSRVRPADPVPAPRLARPLSTLNPAQQDSRSEPPVVPTPASRTKPLLPPPGAGTSAKLAAKAKTPSPSVDLDAQLKALADAQQLQARRRPDPTQQAGEGMSNIDASSADQAAGPMAMYSARDFIRAQIERRWYLDRTAAGAGEFVVSLHLKLKSDGTVSAAEIVDGSSFSFSPAYRSAASSLRDAALLSSPLGLPPGSYDWVKDVILTFSPKDVLD
jgi:hypothetical protein